MAIALTDLIKDLDRKEVLDDFIQVGKVLGLSTGAWQPGEPIYNLIVIFADQVTRLWNNVLVKALRAMFLDFGEGDWLTLFAGTFYETWRQEETFAIGTLVIENRSLVAFYNFSPGDIKVQNAAGKTFTATTGGSLGPWSGSGLTPRLTLSMKADEVGAASNTVADGIAHYPTAPLSAFAGIYVYANTVFIGSDQETDASLKKRARLSTGPLSPASPRSAYESVALSARVSADGIPLLSRDAGYDIATPVNVNRTRITEPGGGVVHVYVASPAGAADGDDVTPGSDVFYINALIQDRVAPAGISVTVASAVVRSVTVPTISVYIDRESLVTTQEAYDAVLAAVTEFFEMLPIGGMRVTPMGTGYVFLSEIAAKASESLDGIFRVAISGSDVALLAAEVAVPDAFTILTTVVTQ